MVDVKKMLLAFLTVLTLPFGPAVAAEAAPAVVQSSPSAAAVPYHIVRPGETIKKIAAFYHITPAQLRAWNGIIKPNQPAVDGVLNLAKPQAQLAGWRTWAEGVTPGQVNWDPAAKCPVVPAKLRKVWVTYIDFYGASHLGSVVVNQAIAAQTQRVFRVLYRMRFRIQGMSPMSLNAPYLSDMGTVTAGYSCRKVAGTQTLSQHAYGMAIDINPVQNPMIRGTSIDPVNGSTFLARAAYRRGMVHAAGAVRAFTANGFYWGGRWHSLKDYMHFSPTNK